MTCRENLFYFFLCLLLVVSTEEINIHQIKANLHRSVTSDQLFERDSNNNCYYPGICDVDITECNIPRIPLSQMTVQSFIDDFVSQSKPVIISLNDSELESIINNKTGIFEWNTIIETIQSESIYNDYVKSELNGSPLKRGQMCDIHPLEDRQSLKYGNIIKSIDNLPSLLTDIDLFNHFIGYLSTVDGELLGNKWTIFGTTGSGAQFHFDYFLTSFWNLALEGSKYWLLIPPQIVENVIFEPTDIPKIINMPIWQFYLQIYPYLQSIIDNSFERNSDATTLYKCMQYSGDIVFAPPKFYHSTFNLNATLSISRNLITTHNYKSVFEFLTGIQQLNGIDSDGNIIGTKHAIELCAALYRYNQTMFADTGCMSRAFLQRLNSFEPIRSNLLNSDLYIQACNYASSHATFSSFY